MKPKKNILFISLLLHFLWLNAYPTGNSPNTCPNDSSARAETAAHKVHIHVRKNFKREFSYMGIPFVAAGLIVKKETKTFVHSETVLNRLFTNGMMTILNMFR